MKLSIKTSGLAATRLALVAAVLAAPQFASAAARTFLSLTITPPSTNMTAGATVTANVALTTKISSGTTASGQVTNIVSIAPPAFGVTLNINPSWYVIGTSVSSGQTSNSTLMVATTPGTPPNAYVVQVVATAGPTNANLATITPITNTFFLTVASGASDSFSMSMSPASTNVFRGVATNVSATVSFTGNSSAISGTITNGVTVTGPDPVNVSANLNSIYAPVTNNFGQTNLVLTISASASAAPGTYQIIVRGTNSSFTANTPIAGVASVTNTFVITDKNSFAMSLSPDAETVVAIAATNITAIVTLTNNSPVLAEALTNGVTVMGPGTNVTASLNQSLASPVPGGGTANLALTIAVNANAVSGTYQVIVGATNNNFTANSPIPGVALIANTLVLVRPAAPPSIQSFTLSGTTLTISGTNGTPVGEYVVLASTNLVLPSAQWTPVLTNTFDGSGNFNVSFGLTNPLSPNAAQQFFALSSSLQGTTTVGPPMFSPPAAAYASEQAVTITSTTSGATIRYTTDGSTPSSIHGSVYIGPVTMQQPVVTNLSGTFSNASGVTMLKAIAYKSGLPDSPVFTGNYQIMVPPPETSASPLRGIAHLAYRVTNLAAARHFWKDYLGFAEPFLLPNSNTVAVIKINDQQYVELYEGPVVPPQYQLVNYGYQVSDVAAHRAQLAVNGVSVPASVSTNALGNLSFFSTDPDGHAIEWVQYLSTSLTGQTQGQAMPGTQVFGYIISTGGFTANSYALNNAFYITQCGFLPNGTSGIDTHLIGIPNSDGFYEHGTYNTLDAATAGKKSQVDLLNFRGITIQQSVALLTNRDPSITIDLHLTTKGRYVGNVYDPDGTRVELDDE
jgi:catechol 2,3-dioxygenase-like lactoylglutathione lyase family enzyme